MSQDSFDRQSAGVKARVRAILALAAWTMVGAVAQDKPGKTLDMYFVDTEGGLAALYVSPSGESQDSRVCPAL